MEMEATTIMITDKRIISREEAKDAGLVLVLMALYIVYLRGNPDLLLFPGLLLLICMLTPGVFRPFGLFWFGLSRLLGSIMIRFILTIIFFLVVTPVAVVRRLSGCDPLRLGEWKKGRKSVFRDRDHFFTADDLNNPY